MKLRQPAAGDTAWDDEVNDNAQIAEIIIGAIEQGNHVIAGVTPSDGGGLQIDYAAGVIEVDKVSFNITAGNKSCTDNDLNWLYVDDAGDMQINVTPPTGNYVPIAFIDCSGADINRIGDLRHIAGTERYKCTAITGGAAGALDALPVGALSDKQRCLIMDANDTATFYEFQGAATDAEQVATHPFIIRPDDYAAAGVWYEQRPSLISLQDQQFAADAEASDAYAVTLDPAPAALFPGMMVIFTANTSNTGAATLNVNALGAESIKKKHDQDLETGDIESGQVVAVAYDGTNFQMLSPANDGEIGTWTFGVAFGGGTTGITYGSQTGRYVRNAGKITISGYMALTSKGTANGNATITGLPLVCKNDNGAYASVSLTPGKISFANQHQHYININATTIAMNEVTEAGTITTLTDANFANDSTIMISATYEYESA